MKNIEQYRNTIYNTDCIAGMSMLPDHSIDMILCDLPYGITACRWDSIIPFDLLWEQYNRVIKANGAIVLTAAQPFTTALIRSNQKAFRYCWYWVKNRKTGFTFAKYQPMRCVEDICVFYKKAPTYNPQGIIVHDTPILSRGKRFSSGKDSIYRKDGSLAHDTYQAVSNYPSQVLYFPCEYGLHPTQKPVALFEYLIRTYTNPGDLVLDSCMGSGTTKIACRNTGRDYVGFEIDSEYYKIAISR